MQTQSMLTHPLPLFTYCLAFALTAACAAPQKAITAAAPPTTVSACSAPAYRQFDFWIGDWDLVVKARTAPASEEWAEARGTNSIVATLGGCGIEERFSAAGPGPVWSGMSVSRYVDAESKWRQTWIDDQGSYMTFAGESSDGRMTLMGEPRTKDGVTRQMRMVFSDIAPARIHWSWESTIDGGATWKPAMIIDYTRRANRSGT